MIIYSIIQKSQLEDTHRLDAEYYQPEYLEFSERLIETGEVPLGKVAFITDGQHGYHKVDPLSDIRHITAKNVTHWLVNDDGADRLAKETHEKNKRSVLAKDDILISTAGTVGAAGIVLDDILPANIDQDVARVHVLDRKSLDPCFLIAFLNSKYGQFQIERETTGQIQTHLALEKIKNRIFIPIPEWQNVVSTIVRNALSELQNSKSFCSQAENLLLEELGLQNFETDGELWNVVNLSDAKAAGRMDAEYFQPKYELVDKHIEDKKHSTLGEMSVFVGHATQAPYDEHGSMAVLAQKHMKRNLQIDVDGFDNFTTGDLIKKNDKKYILKKGDILISSAGEPGLTSVWIGDRGTKVIPGSFVTVVRLKDNVEPLYVGVFLNAPAGKLQFERNYTGSVQQYVYPSKMKEILVPILPEKIQQKIAELVRKSHESCKKGKDLLRQAKSKVESLIEN